MSEDEKIADKIESIHFMVSMTKKLKVDNGLLSVQMARAPHDYYSWNL